MEISCKAFLLIIPVSYCYGSEIPFASINRNNQMDNGIIRAIFERILNIFTMLLGDLIPKIMAITNPISIKKYSEIGIHKLMF